MLMRKINTKWKRERNNPRLSLLVKDLCEISLLNKQYYLEVVGAILL